MKSRFLTKAEYIDFKNQSRKLQKEIVTTQRNLALMCKTQKQFDHFLIAKIAEERLEKVFVSKAKPHQHFLTQPIVRIK